MSHTPQDVSDYMNPCPYTISHEAPLPQVFNLFRTMGLRHLPVLKEQGIVSGIIQLVTVIILCCVTKVVGIITRHDLTHEKLHERRNKKKIESETIANSQNLHAD